MTDLEEHLQNLRKVFGHLWGAGLHFKPAKYHLAKLDVKYMDYIVSKIGLALYHCKVIQNFLFVATLCPHLEEYCI